MQKNQITLITGQDMPIPDSESSLVVAALAELGVASEVAIWRDTRDWSAAQLVVLRTPWDYGNHLACFLAWVTHVANVAQLRNDADVIRWNVNKRYLLDLARLGVPIVPTEIPLDHNLDAKMFLTEFATRHGTNEVVIKPTVGINADGAERAAASDPALAQHLTKLLKSGGALVQPFAPSIRSTGEISLIFFGSSYSHAVCKLPRDGDFRVQDNHGGSVHQYQPSAQEIEMARAALAAAPAPTTYARVDLVYFQGLPAVMELELIEPELFLRYSPAAVNVFARLLARELHG